MFRDGLMDEIPVVTCDKCGKEDVNKVTHLCKECHSKRALSMDEEY